MNNWKEISDEELPELKIFLHYAEANLYKISAFPNGIDGTIDLIHRNGTWLIYRDKDEVVGCCALTLGQPKNLFNDKDVGYIYLLIIKKEYQRKSLIFGNMIRSVKTYFLNKSISKVFFKGYKDNKLTHMIFSKVGEIIGEEPNTQGYLSYLYMVNLNNPSKLIKNL